MTKWVVFVIPALMILNRALAAWAAAIRARGYGKHIAVGDGAPGQQAGRKAGINARYLILVAAYTVIFYLLANWALEPYPEFRDGFLGFGILAYLVLVGQRATLVLLFRFAAKHPQDLTGSALMSARMGFKTSQYQVLVPLLAIAFAAGYLREPFLIGGAVGIALLFALHWIWLRKERQRAAGQKPPESEAAGKDA